jgi:hypothetical protein
MSALGQKQTCAVQLAMSALGQKQTCAVQKSMSALLLKAEMCGALGHVSFGPKADMLSSCEYKLPIFDGLADYVLASWTFISSLIVTRRVWLDSRKPHFCPALWARRQIENQACRIEGFPL